MRQPCGVAQQWHGIGRQIQLQAVRAGLEERLGRLDRPGNHTFQIDRLALQADLSAGHAADVHQIVDQAGKVRGLPVDGVQAVLQNRVLEVRVAYDRQRIADGCQRIAQLMRQHGEELLVALARLLQRLHPTYVREVAGDLGDSDQPALIVHQGRHGHLRPELRTIAAHAPPFPLDAAGGGLRQVIRRCPVLHVLRAIEPG